MEGIHAITGDGLYAGRQMPGQELASFKLAQTLIDLSNPALFNSTAGAGGSLSQGVNFDIHGDWLYVDMSSAGACQATFYADSDDSQTFTLLPGNAIRTRFDRVRIFSTQAQASSQTNQGNIQNPVLRLVHGMGMCPFFPVQLNSGGTSPVIYQPGAAGGPTAAVANTNAINISAGAVVNAGITATQVTAAAETSLLEATLVFVLLDGNQVPEFADASIVYPVSTAGAGKAAAQFNFNDVRAPRGAYQVYLQVQNVGSATTNAIAISNSSISVS